MGWISENSQSERVGEMKKPKDLQLARMAYNAYHGDSSLHSFDTDFSHEYQMRWVRVARAVIDSYKKATPGGKVWEKEEGDEVVHARQTMHKKGPSKKRYADNRTRGPYVLKQASEKLAGYDKNDANDRKLLEKASGGELVNIRARMLWRDKERKKLGAKPRNDDLRVLPPR